LPELRKDPITGRWVIIATDRKKRPKDYSILRGASHPGICPFCYGNEGLTPLEVLAFRPAHSKPHTPDWWVRVVPNKYPALRNEGEMNRRAEGMYDWINGIGVHEIIIETPDHSASMAEIPQGHLREVLWAYRQRIEEHSQDPRIDYVLIFKNHGAAAGASLEHPHTQLIATPVVPIRVREEMKGAEAYYEYKDRCVFCDMISQEEKKPLRLVEQSGSFVSLNPYASRLPFETWILPRRHVSHFENLRIDEMEDLAFIMHRTLGRIYNLLSDPPFNMMLHVSPPHSGDLPYYHWHFEIIPTLTTVAGFEWGSGFYINPTAPEEACRFLRGIDWRVGPTKNEANHLPLEGMPTEELKKVTGH
jgi:UDPglucose--hexose-1-phosphate uridylyltransferase